MKILIAAHRIGGLSGSELYVVELARALSERGATVGLFTLFAGPLAKQARQAGIRVFDAWGTDEVRQFAPDIVHTHHVSMFHLATELLPGVPIVHGLLGVLPDLEQVPIGIERAHRLFAVSERVRDVALERGRGDLDITVIRNWFDERDLEVDTKRFRPAADGRHRVLVVSNNDSPERDRALAPLIREGLISVTEAGDDNSVEITARYLRGFDLVISIGRTVLHAAAVGVPVLVADHHLSDGILTADAVDKLAEHNFTGRVHRIAFTEQHLRDAIVKSKAVDLDLLSRKVRADYGLSARARLFLDIYAEVLREPRRGNVLPAGEGLVYLNMAQQMLEPRSPAHPLVSMARRLRHRFRRWARR